MRNLGVALLVLLTPGLASGQVIEGRVVDAVTGEAVVGATVRVSYAETEAAVVAAVTDSTGFFHVDLGRPGTVRVVVERVGFAASSTTMTVEADEIGVILVRLAVEAVRVEPIEVSVRRRPTLGVDPLEEVANRELLYGRVGTGSGTFLNTEQIQEIAPSALTNVLVRVPGYRLTNRGGGTNSPSRVRLQSRRRCDRPPTFYVNGRRFIPTPGINSPTPVLDEIQGLYPPSSLLAVEVYRNSWDAPIEYQNFTSECGIIAFWFGPSAAEASGDGQEGVEGRPTLALRVSIERPLTGLRSRLANTELEQFPAVGLRLDYGRILDVPVAVAVDWAPVVTVRAVTSTGTDAYRHSGQFWRAVAMGSHPLLSDVVRLSAGGGARFMAARRIGAGVCGTSDACRAVQHAARPRVGVVAVAEVSARVYPQLHLGVSWQGGHWDDAVLASLGLHFEWSFDR